MRTLLDRNSTMAVTVFPLLLLLGGCPDDANGVAPGGGDGGSDDGGAADGDATGAEASGADAAAGAQVERAATVVLAAPDLAPQYFCFVGFEPAADGSPQGSPVVARGPWGVPDPTDPNAAAVFGPSGALDLPVKLSSGFPYGAIVRLGLRKRDAPFFDQLAGVLFTVSDVAAMVFAGNGIDSTTCKDAWTATQGSNVPRFATKPGQIQVGQSWLVAVSGCAQASMDPQCAGGNNLTATEALLDLTSPGSFAGNGDAEVAIQVADLSPYAGYQDVDFYLQAMRPAGDAGADGGAQTVPDGSPLLLSSQGKGLRWTEIADRAAGVKVSSANASLALLLVVEHGDEPFCVGQPGCTTTTAIPIQPFVDKYAKTAGAAWAGHQTFVLFGRPPLDPSEKPADFLRLGIFASTL
jgi:hypothetical protein